MVKLSVCLLAVLLAGCVPVVTPPPEPEPAPTPTTPTTPFTLGTETSTGTVGPDGGVLALGDVTARIRLTPVALGEAMALVDHLFGDGRRSVYAGMRRNFLSTLMQTFDAPTPFSTVGRRNVTNVPAQSLALMNDPLFHQQARVWTERLLRETREADAAARGGELLWCCCSERLFNNL